MAWLDTAFVDGSEETQLENILTFVKTSSLSQDLDLMTRIKRSQDYGKNISCATMAVMA